MVRTAKKSQFDVPEEARQRSSRKTRSHKSAAFAGSARQGRQHGWGYVKRRHAMAGDE